MRIKNLFKEKEVAIENLYNKIYANVAEDLKKIESHIKIAMLKFDTRNYH